MTEEALQIDFRPQPRGIAVVTSAPISEIADSGNYAAFQDLIDGYASAFAKVHVFSPSGESVVKPAKAHRVEWHSGPRWLSPTNGLWWTVLSNRREFENIELVRTFGPRAGVVGKALSKFSKSPHVSSSDDLIGNTWRDRTGWRSAPTKVVNRVGLLRANMLSATLDWELEYLSETGYTKDLLLGKTGLATDIYTPIGTTDPNRHPVVLWAGPARDEDATNLIEESALATKSMIENVEFVVVAQEGEAQQLRDDVLERDLPVTVAAVDEVEPLVDLIERTWACVTTPSRGFPHGLAMFAASAGIPLISLGELEETHGFKNHLNYMAIEPDNHEAVAYALQLLRRWSTWSLRIGSAGKQLVEDRYSTKTVALREGEQLARIARNEELEADSPVQLKQLKPWVSPAAGQVSSLTGEDDDGVAEDEVEEADISYDSAGFDLVAAALADIAGTGTSSTSSPPVETSDADMGQDAISALFAENDADTEVPEEAPVDLADGDLDQDAISALFATNNPEPADEPVAEESDDLDQDAISALFAASDPEPADEPVAEESGDLDQDAISAVFAANDPEPADEPVVEESGDLDQDAISALFAANDPESEDEPAAEESGDLDQDAISALFAANGPEPAAESTIEEFGDPDQDVVSAILEAKNNAAEPTQFNVDELDVDLPEVNLIQFDSGAEIEDEELSDEFDSIDVDPGLIAAILEGKDVDPSL